MQNEVQVTVCSDFESPLIRCAVFLAPQTGKHGVMGCRACRAVDTRRGPYDPQPYGEQPRGAPVASYDQRRASKVYGRSPQLFPVDGSRQTVAVTSDPYDEPHGGGWQQQQQQPTSPAYGGNGGNGGYVSRQGDAQRSRIIATPRGNTPRGNTPRALAGSVTSPYNGGDDDDDDDGELVMVCGDCYEEIMDPDTPARCSVTGKLHS
jgi:hypothetical protein